MIWRCPPRVPDFSVCACSKQVSKSHTGTPQSTTRREPSRKATDHESATYQSRRKGKQTDERDVYATMVGSSARPEFGRLGHRARTRLARERHTWSAPTNDSPLHRQSTRLITFGLRTTVQCVLRAEKSRPPSTLTPPPSPLASHATSHATTTSTPHATPSTKFVRANLLICRPSGSAAGPCQHTDTD